MELDIVSKNDPTQITRMHVDDHGSITYLNESGKEITANEFYLLMRKQKKERDQNATNKD